MAKEKKKDPDLLPLKALFLGLGFVLHIADKHKKETKQLKELEDLVAEQKQKIFDLELLVKGYETSQPLRIEVCTKCAGAGAFMIKEEVEECDECDGAGWKEQIQKD
jgi:DnaJ-class molecular chaperone